MIAFPLESKHLLRRTGPENNQFWPHSIRYKTKDQRFGHFDDKFDGFCTD